MANQSTSGSASSGSAAASGSTPANIGPASAMGAGGVSSGGAMSSLAGGLPILTPGYLTSHRVGIPGQKDVIWNPIYDTQQYPHGGVTVQALAFFAAQQGAGTSYSPGAYFGSAGKTQFDTNLQSPNAFTLGQEFYCIGSETDIIPGIESTTWPTVGAGDGYLPAQNAEAAGLVFGAFVNDVWVLSQIGFKSLKIGTDRFYIQDGPLGKFPSRVRLALASAVAAVQEASGGVLGVYEESYAQPSGIPYVIVPIYFQTNQLFTDTYSFAGQIALPSGFSAILRERLNGYLIRQAT